MTAPLYLARHAETVFNAGARMQGHMAHTPLTHAGIAQAHSMGDALRAHFGGKPDIDLWASPSGRTLQTMAVVAEHLEVDADVVEAACRTLDKPSVPRLEKFIGELINKKIEMNQLDNSDLTFREIGIIKKTFVNILAGYYHSRIEYPNQKDPDTQEPVAKDMLLKGKKS